MIKASRVSSPIYSYSPLAALKPTTLLTMLNAPQLEAMAQAVEETIFKIIQDSLRLIWLAFERPDRSVPSHHRAPAVWIAVTPTLNQPNETESIWARSAIDQH